MWNPLSLARAIFALPAFMEQTMSALDDLKAAVAKNDAGIAHVAELLREAANRVTDDPSDEDLEEIAAHLNEGADQLQGMTLVAPQTSGVAGATTANQAPADPPTPETPATGVVS